eukprot:313905-Prorocentrum_lima.AAC.1
MGDGSWEEFMADRFPEKLDDEIKKVYRKIYLVAEHVEPEDLLATLPMSLPMKHIYEDEGSIMFGIA